MAEWEVAAKVEFKDTITAESAIEAARIVGDRLRQYADQGIAISELNVTKARAAAAPGSGDD